MSKIDRFLNKLEMIMESRELEEEEWWTWEGCKKRIEEFEQAKLRYLRQKSRVNQVMYGDDNSAVYDDFIKGRKVKNMGLIIDGVQVSKPSLVKRDVLKHFRGHFKEDNKAISSCDNIQKIPADKAEELIRAFPKEAIKDAIFYCSVDKVLSPDGFNLRFVKKY